MADAASRGDAVRSWPLLVYRTVCLIVLTALLIAEIFRREAVGSRSPSPLVPRAPFSWTMGIDLHGRAQRRLPIPLACAVRRHRAAACDVFADLAAAYRASMAAGGPSTDSVATSPRTRALRRVEKRLAHGRIRRVQRLRSRELHVLVSTNAEALREMVQRQPGALLIGEEQGWHNTLINSQLQCPTPNSKADIRTSDLLGSWRLELGIDREAS